MLRFQTRVALAFALLAVVLFGAAGAQICTRAADTVRANYGYELEGIATVAAMHVDGEKVEAVLKSRDMRSPQYKALKGQLAAIRKATRTLKVQDLVLFRRTGKTNEWEYIVDGDESEDSTDLGFPFDATNWPEMRAAYNGPTHDRDYRKDQYGIYLSGYAPVHNKSGQTVAVLETYSNFAQVKRLEDEIRRAMLLALGLAIAASIPLSLWIGALLAAPLRTLTEAARKVGEGDLSQSVSLGDAEEFQNLARTFNEMVKGLRERDFVKDAFEKYVSKEVAQKVMEMPLEQVLKGERRRVSVVFTDVRRFTEMSERMRPEEVLTILNDHFSMLIDVLFEFEGTLDKFLGDGLMAIFGAPISHGNDAERAVRAALRMQERIREYNDKRKAAGQPGLELGIGVNTGPAVAGNIGSAKRKEYSVIGDTVNVAARLQAIASGGDVLISASTYEELKDVVEADKLAPQALKGKSGTVEVYRVLRLLPGR